MQTKNKVFFGEHGITATSANFLANIAKEELAEDEFKLKSATFITKSLDIVGSTGAPKIVSEGKDEEYVADLPKIFNHLYAMKSFCAWMREAIKAKEDEMKYWNNYDFATWLKEIEHIECPEAKDIPIPTEDDIFGEMNVKEREEYLSLEASAAALGTYIHERCSLNEARKQLHKGLANPTWHEGSGRDTLIFNNTASVKPEIVDTMYDKLQNQHRSMEQRVNSIKAKVKEELNRRAIKRHLDMMEEQKRVESETSILIEKYSKFIKEKLEEVNKLKIVIPEHLKSTYEYLNSKGKETEN